MPDLKETAVARTCGTSRALNVNVEQLADGAKQALDGADGAPADPHHGHSSAMADGELPALGRELKRRRFYRSREILSSLTPSCMKGRLFKTGRCNCWSKVV